MLTSLSTNDRVCMFCGEAVANRGEAYYDHLIASDGCHDAWDEWKERLDQDWAGGD